MTSTRGGAKASTAVIRLAVLAVTIAGAALLSARPATAQTPETRWQVSSDFGFQTTTLANIVTEPITFERFAEIGELTRLTEIDRQPTIHVAAGVSVWRTLGFRIGFSQFARTDDMLLSVSIPHPFFFDRHRQFSAHGTLEQRERSVDVHARWMAHQSDRVAFSVFGGPTVYRAKLDVATLQTSEEEYPFEASPVTGIILFERTPVSVGYGVGADLAVFFSRHVGVGWLARYNRASATITLPDDGFFATVLEQTGVTTDVRFGGAIVSGGLRFRF